MEHKAFRIISILSLIIIIVIGVLYNYYITYQPKDLTLRFVLKPIPISILVINIIVYFCIYQLHIYALLVLMGLLFCGLGDILLMFYIPTIPGYNNIIFLMIGGASFAIARGVMSLAFATNPYRQQSGSNRYITVTLKRILLATVISMVYTVTMIVYFTVNMKNKTMSGLLSGYIIIMGIQILLSLLRIKGFEEESTVSQVLGVLGTVFFTVSDTLLFWNLFLTPIPYGNITSISFYWLGMYLLTVSVVRNSKFDWEKGDSTAYLPLYSNN